MVDNNNLNPSSKRLQSYVHNASSLSFQYKTVAQSFDELAVRYPDHECLVFKAEDKRYTYSTLRHEIDSMSQSLLELGFNKNDHLAVALPSMSESVVLTYVISKLGLVKVNIDPFSVARDWAYALNKMVCKGIVIASTDIAMNRLQEALSNGEQEIPLKHIILTGSNTTTSLVNALWYNDLLKKGNAKVIQNASVLAERQASIDPDASLSIITTSGSTGTPKATVLTNFGALNSMMLYFDHFGQSCSRYCVPLFMYHVSGGIMGTLLIAVSKCTVIFPNFVLDTLATMRAVHEEKCTGMLCTPGLFRDILAHPDREKYDLSSLQYVVVGATSVDEKLLSKVEVELNITRVGQGYAMTEAGCGLTSSLYADSDDERRHTSVGRCMPHMEMKVVDDQGQTVPIECEGELWARSRLFMRGYYGDPVATAAVITDEGWLKTGDLVRMDQDGFLFFVGRKKEVIIRAGSNISPIEVERAIGEHPSVAEVHVFSIPDPDVDEAVCASVILKPGTQCQVDELKTFLVDKLTPKKIPTHIQFVAEFPRNALGKVPKHKLAEQMIRSLN